MVKAWWLECTMDRRKKLAVAVKASRRFQIVAAPLAAGPAGGAAAAAAAAAAGGGGATAASAVTPSSRLYEASVAMAVGDASLSKSTRFVQDS